MKRKLVNKEEEDIYTYTRGYDLKMYNDVTTKDVSILCEELNNTFNSFYKTDKYSFVPEKICEGGILFYKYPNKEDNGYKSLRFMSDKSRIEWPFIKEDYKDVLSCWKEQNTLLFKKSFNGISTDKVYTCLKSFNNSPCWTLEELRLFEDCLDKIDICVFKSSYPKKKALKNKH